MTISKNKIIFVGTLVCLSIAAPLEKVSSISKPQDTSCPGRERTTYDGGIRPLMVESVAYPAVVPRTISKDSILSTTLEEFVRSKRHTAESAEILPKLDEAADILERTIVPEQKTNTSEVLSQLDLAREVDLVFLVDVTGSMSPYILGVRDSINDIVDDLLNSTLTENFVEDLRLSFVGYRDFGDGEDQFTILPFTKNVTEFRQFVEKTSASGGANVPEDVFGGLDHALKLKWGEPTRTRLIFHIADAPGHGCELHTLSSDEFPGGDPKERTPEGLFEKVKDMQIQYFFGNITSDTDVMINRFSEALGSEVKTFDIGVSGSSAAGYDGAFGGSVLAAAPEAARSIYESVKSAVEYSVKDKAGGSKK